MYSKALTLAILWLVISTVLLSLPGSDIPHVRFLDFPYSDKLVHVGMFALLSALFSYPITLAAEDFVVLRKKFIATALCVLAYGVLMEFVQKYFVPGRSFDFLDIVSDGIGSLAGVLAVMKIYYKKIGPDGNRGRNQN
jgi:VanZ family protein